MFSSVSSRLFTISSLYAVIYEDVNQDLSLFRETKLRTHQKT